MRKIGLLLPLLLMMTLIVPAGLPVRAQGGFNDEQQAALDDMKTAFDNFVAANTFSADLIQELDQNIGVDFSGQSIQMIQKIHTEGTLQVERVAGSGNANREEDLTQSLSQNITGAGQDQNTAVGPYKVSMIVLNDRIYLKMDMGDELAGAMPEGWYDVTDGADMFPGLSMFNIQQMTRIEGTMDADYFSNLLETVTDVETMGSEVEKNGVKANRYRLTLDAATALQTIGAENIQQMFNSEAIPFDMPKLIDLMYNDPDTTYTVEIAVGEDQELYQFVYNIYMNIDVGSDLITDPSLQGAELTLEQTLTQTLQPFALGEPVTIEAPELAQ